MRLFQLKPTDTAILAANGKPKTVQMAHTNIHTTKVV